MYDALIVGAGLSGSSLAATLANQGWDVALVERRQLPHHKVCGEFLSPESQSSLRAMRLYETVAALAPAQMTEAHLFSRRGLDLRVKLPGTAWGLSRFTLDSALAQAAAQRGVQVLIGTTATEVRANRNWYQISIRDAHGQPSTMRCRTIVAACGRHSFLGLRPHVPATRQRPTYVGVKCHYEGLDLPPEVRLYLFDGGYVGMCPIEGQRANVCMLVTRRIFAPAGSVPAMIDMAARLNPTFGRDLASGRVVPKTDVAVAPVDTERDATPWASFARLGDAAVMIPPLCGDGMAMALRSAEICARLAHEFLRGTRSLACWEEDYCAAWHAEFDAPARLGRRLQRLLGMPGIGTALIGIGALLPPLSARLVRSTRVPVHPLS
jgi:flavin-dependent dehydrogenase